jgi:hypothetical protein
LEDGRDDSVYCGMDARCVPTGAGVLTCGWSSRHDPHLYRGHVGRLWIFGSYCCLLHWCGTSVAILKLNLHFFLTFWRCFRVRVKKKLFRCSQRKEMAYKQRRRNVLFKISNAPPVYQHVDGIRRPILWQFAGCRPRTLMDAHEKTLQPSTFCHARPVFRVQ